MLSFIDIKEIINYIFFLGASPVRRDFGRGLMAQQWARFCGRYLCAESIEKFVRTAVPGGAALISDSSGFVPLSQIATKKSGKSHNGTEKKSHLRLRSRSSASGESSSRNASWLTRTIKKAFNSSGETSDFISADDETGRGGHSKRMTKSATAAGSSSATSKTSIPPKRLVIPQVQVTLTVSNNGGGHGGHHGGGHQGVVVRELDAMNASNVLAQPTNQSKKKKKGGTSHKH
jgi:hypothetical protein